MLHIRPDGETFRVWDIVGDMPRVAVGIMYHLSLSSFVCGACMFVYHQHSVRDFDSGVV